ncbi:MAG: molybdate ABC transporter substrate-binding protein [Paracoccaceae bacterium]|nr:molybdate ABC transporter substrate-binding protein [Paracoccaceae bacterium]
MKAYCPFVWRVLALLALALAPMSRPSQAAESALVAVAANFAETAQRLAGLFMARTGDDIVITVGSTGKLYAQIINGAPYDVFLAADQRRPRLLVEGGQGVRGTRFTYAEGRLSLWTPQPDGIPAGGGIAVLARGQFRHLAIANPKLAPYGLAAKQALEHLGLWQKMQPRLVMGQNVGQAFSMVATGNAELGIVARAQVLSPRNGQPGSRWDIPAHVHDPILQDAVLLRHGQNNTAARAFLSYLTSDEARALIASSGYGAGKSGADR